MSARIGGVFPGGPHRVGEGGSAPPRIRGVADFTKAADGRRLERARARRRRRVVLGLLAAMLAGGAGGVLAGLAFGPDPQGQARQNEEASSLDRAISREVNRTLLELWKMEDAERVGIRRRLP